MEQEERQKKVRAWLAIIALCILLVACMAYLGRKAYVAGGRVACDNSNAVLNRDFECEPIAEIIDIDQPNEFNIFEQPIDQPT